MKDLYNFLRNQTKDDLISHLNKEGEQLGGTSVNFWLDQLDRLDNKEQAELMLQLTQKSIEIGEQSRQIAEASLRVAEESRRASERSIRFSRLNLLVAIAAVFVTAMGYINTIAASVAFAFVFILLIVANYIAEVIYGKRHP